MNRERLHSEIIGTLNSLIWLIQRSGDDWTNIYVNHDKILYEINTVFESYNIKYLSTLQSHERDRIMGNYNQIIKFKSEYQDNLMKVKELKQKEVNLDLVNKSDENKYISSWREKNNILGSKIDILSRIYEMNNKESLLANKYINFKIYNTYRQEVSDELTKLQSIIPIGSYQYKDVRSNFFDHLDRLSNITRLTSKV